MDTIGKKNESFEDNLQRLEELINKIEKGEGLDESIADYEEASRLVVQLAQRLEEAEQKVRKSNPDRNDNTQTTAD